MVKIHDDILVKIAEYICSDTNYPFPYRTGRELSLFFGSVGLPYSHDGSTRKWWTLEVLKKINTYSEGGLPSRELTRVIEYLVSPHNSDSQEQQSEQIILINHLIKQFNLELAYVNPKNKVMLFYNNRDTRKLECYEESITVIADNIRRIRYVNKAVRETALGNEMEIDSILMKQSEENIQLLSKIDGKFNDFSQKTDFKLNSIKGDTEQMIKDISQLEEIFDRIDDLESFLIKNLGSDLRKIKYAWDKYKEGQITKKELAKECIKAFGMQMIKKIWKSI